LVERSNGIGSEMRPSTSVVVSASLPHSHRPNGSRGLYRQISTLANLIGTKSLVVLSAAVMSL
jgi:hypothetical protein